MTDDAIGFVRQHTRIGLDVQRSALTQDGVRSIVSDRAALERMARVGTTIKVRHLFLLADPKARKKRGGWRKDLLDCMGRIESRGAVIKDVTLGETTADPKERYNMIAVATDQLANNGRTIHLHKRKQGRRELVFSPEVENKVEKIWLNVRDYPTEALAEAAIKKVDPRYTRHRARLKYLARKKQK